MGELGEARYLREDVGAEGIGISHYRMNPGKRTGFGHRHKEAEEMYVVLNGSGPGEGRRRDPRPARPRRRARGAGRGPRVRGRARTGWSCSRPARTSRATARCSRTGGRARPDAAAFNGESPLSRASAISRSGAMYWGGDVRKKVSASGCLHVLTAGVSAGAARGCSPSAVWRAGVVMAVSYKTAAGALARRSAP